MESRLGTYRSSEAANGMQRPKKARRETVNAHMRTQPVMHAKIVGKTAGKKNRAKTYRDGFTFG